MKKNGKLQMILIIVVVVLLLGGGGTIAAVSYMQNLQQQEAEANAMVSFAEWFDEDYFDQVPAMVVDGTKIGDVVDYGSENYLIDVNGTRGEDYQAYLKTLEENGFKKHVDNGEGLDNGAVLSATYTNDEDLVVTVTHIKNIDKTYVSINLDMALSPNLFYNESYIADNKEGAETTLSLLEQFEVGNSFVIQMKNGHFIISDGGVAEMLPYLLDYLEGLVAEGEKPIIDAWFFTHPHADHMGIMQAFIDNPEYANRVVVNGIYYNMPGANANAKDKGAAKNSSVIKFGSASLKSETGMKPEMYRVQMGQRYYFNDITIDIAFTQEQILPDTYVADINEASTWCMVTIEEQRILMTGDADKGAMKNVMRTYSPEYLSVDILTSFHHSVNTWNTYTDYAPVETILVTRYGMNMNYDSNHYLQENVDEILSYVDGTKILTFPYAKGTAKSLPNLTWEYHTAEQIANRVIVK